MRSICGDCGHSDCDYDYDCDNLSDGRGDCDQELDLDSSQVWSGALQSLNSPSKKLMIYQIYHDLPDISG